MKLLTSVFLASLLLGQLGGISVSPGVIIYVHDIVLAALLVEAFVQYTITNTFRRPKLLGPITLFIAAAVFSLLTNSGRFQFSELSSGALYLVRWVLYAAVYVLVLQPYTAITLWLYGLYAAGVGISLLGIVQFFLYPDLRNLSYLGWDPHYYRLFSTFLDPNFAGIFLVLTILLGLYLWEKSKFRLLVIFGGVISLAGLLLTYSRSSYLALVVGVTIYAFIRKQWIMPLGVLAFVAAIVFLPRTSGSTLNLFRTDSTLARIGSWQEGLTLIGQAPVFGHGFNTLRYLSADNGPVYSRAAAGLDSSILFVGATTGIIGIIVYGYLVTSFIRLGKKFAFYLASFAALGIHSLFVNSAFYPWVMIWMWVITGVIERQ